MSAAVAVVDARGVHSSGRARGLEEATVVSRLQWKFNPGKTSAVDEELFY